MSGIATRSDLNALLGKSVLIFLLVLMSLPLIFALKTALTPIRDIYDTESELSVESITLFNFQRVLGFIKEDDPRLDGAYVSKVGFARALFNSAVFTVLAVVPQIFFSALAAYAFARMEFPGRDALFLLILTALMIPVAVLFIPNFIMIRELGLLNSYLGMAAPFALMTPFSLFFLRQVFLSSPRDVEEAARIDGASSFTIFWRILLPLHRTSISTLAILATLTSWNEFLWPFLVGRESAVQVTTVALNGYRTQQAHGAPDWSGLMAGSILGALPMILLLVFFGRRIVQSAQFSGGR